MSREPSDERELVARMLAGDEWAMEAFADGYFPGLYRYALRVLQGDGELAREIVQTTVCKALAKLESYRGEASLFTWLCACCRNEIAMHLRRTKRHEVVAFEEGGPKPDARSPLESAEAALGRKEVAEQVHQALDALPERYARALEWKYLERVPVKEIADRLDLGPKAAESLLGRARRAFREGYERLIAAPPGGEGIWGVRP